jgi:acyl-CoA synthetase (AMP-forming)/AMP-acid ligase II
MPDDLNNGRRLIGGRSIRWSEERAASAYGRGLWSRDTLADALHAAAQQTPQRVLLVDGSSRLDCKTLHAQAMRLAQAMLARAPAGSVVSFMLPNWHEAAVLYLAATLAGMVVNPILPSLRDRELAFILDDVQTRLIFVPSALRQQDYAAMLSRVVKQLGTPPEVIVLRGEARGHTAWDALLEEAPAPQALPALEADAVRMVLYTSGTTGRPKGVLHSHNSIHALINQLREHWLIERGDKFLVPSPIAHIGGSIYAFESPLLLGTTAVLMDRWDADEAVRLMDAEHCTHMAGATPFLEQLLAAARRAATRLPRLKVFVCGGASVPPSLIRSAAAYFERAVVTRVYGSTEVPVTTVGVTQAQDAAHAADTDGRPGLAEIKLIDNNAAPAGEGEILARAPQMLVGYLHPEDEMETFDSEGYFRTGDLARWVDGSYLVVTGRAKDIIIRNGENISPKEVEDILIGHPDIAEIAIVGLPDARTGERACAVIVSRNPPGPEVASLGAFLDAQGVAKFKIPEQVVLWDALPKNDAGKVLKHQIRAALTAPTPPEARKS